MATRDSRKSFRGRAFHAPVVGVLLLAAGALSLSACATATVGDLPIERLASAKLVSTVGSPVGTVQLMGSGNTITVALVATGLTPGMHGFHLHQTGSCTPPDFTSAGGHLNPYDRQHGLENPAGPHLGDMPNLEVGPSGTVSTTVDLRGMQTELMKILFDADGTAVVIHSGADDYRTDPAGDAGSRVACGVLERA
ncbi:superoxide dismutase family protein [Erythrobacter sp. LQ02-29]|uniref:superoxide dismutase family protein n=1 Tax=Erythrobacter sp. LQ02-29 TaxID=2920384 RepID=UPI001F4E7DCA|nr:superoxide dismutase family protein [Erythrobacter sp. LQ02-29]MCP9221701.1 superoxide dismutase family protein [Erythrobacter sp. LQ02-29]